MPLMWFWVYRFTLNVNDSEQEKSLPRLSDSPVVVFSVARYRLKQVWVRWRTPAFRQQCLILDSKTQR